MENPDLNSKYHKLATEYSKIRSHATVLKKAVLEEQSKILSLKEIIKEQEQKIRKHDQEMESLTFRNEQLTKRVYVLQEELHAKNIGKNKNKRGVTEAPQQSDFTVFDEELQKKIIENAQLASAMADKELEVNNYKEKIEWLEERLSKVQTELSEKTVAYKEQLEKVKKTAQIAVNSNSSGSSSSTNHNNHAVIKQCERCRKADEKSATYWQQEVERWKTECDLLRSRPESNEQLTEYYESQVRDLIEAKQLAQSETSSLYADNEALQTRLEKHVLEKNALESILEKSNEELFTTSENYRTQLDAMTEHLAAQNEKITRQCDEIQMLKHQLSVKK